MGFWELLFFLYVYSLLCIISAITLIDKLSNKIYKEDTNNKSYKINISILKEDEEIINQIGINKNIDNKEEFINKNYKFNPFTGESLINYNNKDIFDLVDIEVNDNKDDKYKKKNMIMEKYINILLIVYMIIKQYITIAQIVNVMELVF